MLRLYESRDPAVIKDFADEVLALAMPSPFRRVIERLFSEN